MFSAVSVIAHRRPRIYPLTDAPILELMAED
jgi:hypothetical protein